MKSFQKYHAMVIIGMTVWLSHGFTTNQPTFLTKNSHVGQGGGKKSSLFSAPSASSSKRFVRPSPSSLLKGSKNNDDVVLVNGERITTMNINGNGDNSVFSTGSQSPHLILPKSKTQSFSPYHILHSKSYSNAEDALISSKSLPLDSCLRLLKQSLHKIIDQRAKCDDNDAFDKKVKIIRIEHRISHTIDPLCWLQAQQEQQKQHNVDINTPTMYFATADSTLDTATYGSSQTYQGNITDQEYWNLIQTLPDSSHLYGGQRFDVNSSNIGEEWQEFSHGFWLLPAVEIRREQELVDPSPSSPSSTSNKRNITIAIHLAKNDDEADFSSSARRVLQILSQVSDGTVPTVPPTTLPPVLSRASTYCKDNMDGQEIYEKGVAAAIAQFDDSHASNLQKVVLARRMDLKFGTFANDNVKALDILRKWKFGNNPGGHLFYIRPSSTSGEFFGCTPERLFQVHRNGLVVSEALAGTRPRGSTQQADAQLSRELFESTKDQAENEITGNYILKLFHDLEANGWVTTSNCSTTNKQEYAGSSGIRGNFFVRRLRHLQHICQRFQVILNDQGQESSLHVIKHLFTGLHPTPAVGGYPKKEAMEFIREYESSAFDRGFYAGPVGYVGKDSAEIVVAIRSGLVSGSKNRGGDRVRMEETSMQASSPKVSVFAGAGIVPGSTVQGEWAETSYKLAVVSSIFPQSPITLQRAPTPNVAWSTAFVEELIRNGVTQFYICPGSRSTPFVAAIAQAARNYVNTVHATSIHDERSAAFRAIGYGRGSGQPAAVITSSGTAIANLYPAIVEAGMDGIPLLVLTADRPYESRDTGANQAIDQVRAFSSTYVRWFRDILPPNDDVPVTVALSDAAHAVKMSRDQRGPVHINVQFRENLAPDKGPIRNDGRQGSVTKYDGVRFTDSPGFQRWSIGGDKWLKSFAAYQAIHDCGFFSYGIAEIADLIRKSERGMIVVGNLRKPSGEIHSEEISQTLELVSTIAQVTGFPIFAGAQSAHLRFMSPAVVPYSELLLRSPSVQENINPDLVLQFGAPLVSTEIPAIIKRAMNEGNRIHHVLVHPHFPSERHDPDFTVSHRIDSDIPTFSRGLLNYLESLPNRPMISSDLAPLVTLGRMLQPRIPGIIDEAVQTVRNSSNAIEYTKLTEPEIFVSLSNMLSEPEREELSLFLSNSMPVRDAELFLYPSGHVSSKSGVLKDIGVNRGASGIDGIIASAAGFSESSQRPTTLLIGDVASLHDINSLHGIKSPKDSTPCQKTYPLTTIVINNDGGGIFSFLPVSKHGNDVSFDEFFGTPTNNFSFEKGAEAFGIPYERATSPASLTQAYQRSLASGKSSLIEAVVAGREDNVAVHRAITHRSNSELQDILQQPCSENSDEETLPLKRYGQAQSASKILVLLHGWMGDKLEWEEVALRLEKSMAADWSIISIDLPGHGESIVRFDSKVPSILDALCLDNDLEQEPELSLDAMASAVRHTLLKNEIESVDALAGYSLGGRVALALKRLCLVTPGDKSDRFPCPVSDDTRLILVSTNPGNICVQSGDQTSPDTDMQGEPSERLVKDDSLSRRLLGVAKKSALMSETAEDNKVSWSHFLHKWYSAPLWGNLHDSDLYTPMVEKRALTLSRRARDLATVLRQCSPPRCRGDDWRSVVPEKTLFLCGDLDEKYSKLGDMWQDASPALSVEKMTGKGHALLVEGTGEISEAVKRFLSTDSKDDSNRPAMQQRRLSFNGLDASRRVATGLKQEEGTDSSGTIDAQVEESASAESLEGIGSIEFEPFSIGLSDRNAKSNGSIQGIGWGETAKSRDKAEPRQGFMIQVLSQDGTRVGIGEVSPLSGLHTETLGDAEDQLNTIAGGLSELEPEDVPLFDAEYIVRLTGGMSSYFDLLSSALGVSALLPSVRAGLEMAFISLAAQTLRMPIHKALTGSLKNCRKDSSFPSNPMLPLNGLITRGGESMQIVFEGSGNDSSGGGNDFESWKVKIGHQNSEADVSAISYAVQMIEASRNVGAGKIRADANRGFEEEEALKFASGLNALGRNVLDRFEYIEEPLKLKTPLGGGEGKGLFGEHISRLERFYDLTSITYALDETVFDIAAHHEYKFDRIEKDLKDLTSDTRGCAALILKPSLLGLELSLQLAKLARKELGIGAVFTSSFDSGVGLAYTSFLATLSDSISGQQAMAKYAHGLGTYCMLDEDCLSPPFESYVSQRGVLNVAPLSRAFYGLGLDELESLSISPLEAPPLSSSLEECIIYPSEVQSIGGAGASQIIESDCFEASTETSRSGREISLFASLPLPFSADVACSRFTDLPQQPRWSPWISSVAYVADVDGETEWTLRIRGVTFRWRASSFLLEQPSKGIRWESNSGLKNTGVVEFIETSDSSCLMKVTMAIVVPRIVSSLFKGTSIFFEDFLRNKILKWSLEMFRDVVKGDLALEEGNSELGDALFGAVEGKASAIEATLSLQVDKNDGGE